MEPKLTLSGSTLNVSVEDNLAGGVIVALSALVVALNVAIDEGTVSETEARRVLELTSDTAETALEGASFN